MPEKEIDLLDYFVVIFKYRIMILIIVLISVILTSVYVFTRPPLYKANVTFFALDVKKFRKPDQTEYPELKPKLILEELVISILKSRKMSDNIINDLNLKNTWKQQIIMETKEKLNRATKMTVSRGGIITLEVVTEDPELSAKIANAYLENLNNFNKELQLSTDVSLVQVIDYAVPPDKRNPRGLIIKSLLAFLISFFVSAFLAIMLDYIRRSGFKDKIKNSNKF